jgi:hypothetical protein
MRNHDLDESSWMSIFQSQASTQFSDALLHSANSNTDTAWLKLRHLPRDAFAIITNRYSQLTVGEH